MNNGWIKLHRKLLDNPLAKKPKWAWLWIILLLLANHDEDNSFIWCGKRIKQEKGQFITGRKKLKEISGIPETTIERILNYLESEHQIGQQKTQKYRLITILKWNEYQIVDNKWTTNGQQTDTIKNLRIKEYNTNSDFQSHEGESFNLGTYTKKLEDSPRRDLNIIALYLDQRKPDITSYEQMKILIGRHLRPAKDLIPFTDDQIINAIPKAKRLTEGWTLETIKKVLTK